MDVQQPTLKVPVPDAILAEIAGFEAEAEKVKRGELSDDVFRPFRLQHGIYGQRQAGYQMIRVKIPFGGLTSTQMRCLAALVEEYSSGIGHVTTRQDIQFHFVPLDMVGTVMLRLAEVDLTTREACGNTVRNVTACPLAGVCQEEAFDVTPYALTVSRHLMRNALNQSLPRKFKIAFSGCATMDCAKTMIHDIGLSAIQKGDGTRGFRMVVGGGLGSAPRLAKLFREFLSVEDLIPMCEAVVKVFDNHGNRKNRTKARMKFVVTKLGIDEFFRQIEAEYDAIKQERNGSRGYDFLSYADEPFVADVPFSVNGGPGSGASHANGDASDAFERWKKTNVIPQRQPGYSAITLKLPTGDMTPTQIRFVADLIDTEANGNIRTTIGQNVLIRWISTARLPEIYPKLIEADLADSGAHLVEDIVACPGTDTCGLGITSSKALARALKEVFPAGNTGDDLTGMSIKISGCHNSCAQHHIATIGLHGVTKRYGDHIAPFYEMHLGGSSGGDGARIGQMTIKLPSRNVSRAITHLVGLFRQERQNEESFPQYLDRAGKSKLKQALIPYSIIGNFDETPEYFYDWEAKSEFSIVDLGPGECAGGALEMITDGILEADQELYQAETLAQSQQYAMTVNKAYRAVLAAAKALLVTEGIEPATDLQTFGDCEARLIKTGVLPAEFSEHLAIIRALNDSDKKPTVAFAEEKLRVAKLFVEACRSALEGIGEDLKLTKGEDMGDIASAPPALDVGDDIALLDLRGVKCPINYVKTKLRLEMMDSGERLAVFLDDGEPIRNVPASLKNDGHTVLSQEPIDEYFKLVVENA
ncbi:MAG: sulfite reductase [Nitrospiraceae bacterium]|nr:sulfite reductase [Nitrospiraceae bacterium]|tara:strand:+ start:229 stop:2673 length:2445 start_codon:yes stop_codon:yes gene_type:complete